jgi:hypothetical protein
VGGGAVCCSGEGSCALCTTAIGGICMNARKQLSTRYLEFLS